MTKCECGYGDLLELLEKEEMGPKLDEALKSILEKECGNQSERECYEMALPINVYVERGEIDDESLSDLEVLVTNGLVIGAIVNNVDQVCRLLKNPDVKRIQFSTPGDVAL